MDLTPKTDSSVRVALASTPFPAPALSLPGGRAGRATASGSPEPAEEGPGSTGRGGGQHPPGATRGISATENRPPRCDSSRRSKGETVVQETTSAAGDRRG